MMIQIYYYRHCEGDSPKQSGKKQMDCFALLAITAKQNIINDEATLRSHAKSFLPRELDFLAKAYGFKYTQVKIRNSRTRWGSCSSKGMINLSFYLMLLPPHLIRYVLLHELCHTVQMNHGPAFWNLLDQCTDGEAKKLRKEMKKYQIPR